MVTEVNPRLGETVLDPAAGTGGFLVEAFEHLRKQRKKADDLTRLQRGTLHGIEPKSLPYLLCQMNLLLHGLEYPEIDPRQCSAFPAERNRREGSRRRDHDKSAIWRRGRKRHPGEFPGRQTDGGNGASVPATHHAEVRRPVGGFKGGRCGMVVPNGVLFGDGVCASIKEELLKEFNLHTMSVCRTACSHLIRAFPRTSFSSTVPGPQKIYGITSNRYPKAGRTTRKPPRFNTKNSHRAWFGGKNGKRTTGLEGKRN